MQSDLISKQILIKFIDKKVVPELLLHDNISGAGVMAGLSKVLEEMDVFPTIDAVPVVRCRDCKHWSGRNDKPGVVTAIGYCDHPKHHIMPLMPGWFCADGAKMDLKEDEHDHQSI